jgi:hypothetical protein
MKVFEKLIEIDNIKKIPYKDSFGTIELYPNGTKRTIKKFTFNGWKYYTQITSIKNTAGDDGTLYYNDWKNTELNIKFQRKLKLEKINESNV